MIISKRCYYLKEFIFDLPPESLRCFLWDRCKSRHHLEGQGRLRRWIRASRWRQALGRRPPGRYSADGQSLHLRPREETGSHTPRPGRDAEGRTGGLGAPTLGWSRCGKGHRRLRNFALFFFFFVFGWFPCARDVFPIKIVLKSKIQIFITAPAQSTSQM